MNTPSDTLSQTALHTTQDAATTIPASRRFYWSVRRELWENRSVYIALLAVAALILAGFLIGLLRVGSVSLQYSSSMHSRPSNNPAVQPYTFAVLLLMGTSFLVTIFYCLGALYNERSDRSILFWKSLPVSDLTAVSAKASIAIVFLPVFTFLLTLATGFLMLLINSAVLLGQGQSMAVLWTRFSLVQMPVMVLYHLLSVHALWYAPIYAYLLLVSAWSRRVPFLWAVLPLLAIGAVEKIAFNTSHFLAMLGNRIGGGDSLAPFPAPMSMDPLMELHVGQFLISPGLWIGLAVAAAFLAAAVQLRRYRGPL